jgi:electron transfer flavoprotein alpha subunit
MPESIWVLAEPWRGAVSETTFELLALGRDLAQARGVPLQAILLGHGVKPLASALGAADGVLVVDHPALAELAPEACAHALAQLIQQRRPAAFLIPLTNLSSDIATLAAAMTDTPFFNNCKDVRAAGGGLEAQCVLYGGKMVATASSAGRPALFAVLPGTRAADPGRSDKAPPVEEAAVSLPAEPRIQFKRYLEPEAGDVDITQKDVLVAVGRGIQTKDNLDLAEELAGLLGGAVCGSRPVIDQGWLPLSRQVGKSGMQVKPKLYLALGVSGAPEHLEGMQRSRTIVAVNTDPKAPIFDVAHYGVAGDLLDVVPALIEKLKT